MRTLEPGDFFGELRRYRRRPAHSDRHDLVARTRARALRNRVPQLQQEYPELAAQDQSRLRAVAQAASVATCAVTLRGVTVEILYCPVEAGTDRRAASRGRVAGNATTTRTPREGAKSQYDVVVDGETIFSKQKLGRYPEDGEIVELLSSR